MPTTWQYATIYWIVHYQQIELGTRRPNLLPAIRFLFIQGSKVRSSFPLWGVAARSCVYDTLDSYGPLYDIYFNVLDTPISPLFTVCAFGLFDLLEEPEMISSLDWHEKGHSGAMALYTAATYGVTDTVDFLIHKGLDLAGQTQHGETASHRAAEYGHTSTTGLLLHKGAQVGLRDDEGWTALDFATRLKDRVVVSQLVQSGARDEA